MEIMHKYWIQEEKEKFCIVKGIHIVSPNPAFTRTVFSTLHKSFRINTNTRKIHKIYKVNHSLGMKLFEAYLDKHPQDIVYSEVSNNATSEVNNGKDI